MNSISRESREQFTAIAFKTIPHEGSSFPCVSEMRHDVFELMGRKWTVPLLRTLSARALRFGELQRRIPGIKHKVLTQVLRRLEANRLIRRVPVPGNAEYSCYSLTAAGRDLLPIIDSVERWSDVHCTPQPSADARSDNAARSA